MAVLVVLGTWFCLKIGSGEKELTGEVALLVVFSISVDCFVLLFVYMLLLVTLLFWCLGWEEITAVFAAMWFVCEGGSGEDFCGCVTIAVFSNLSTILLTGCCGNVCGLDCWDVIIDCGDATTDWVLGWETMGLSCLVTWFPINDGFWSSCEVGGIFWAVLTGGGTWLVVL
jgi:hypothetical protein